VINDFTAISAVMNAPIKPIDNNWISQGEKCVDDLIMSNPVAATMVGTARRNENSTASFLDNPVTNPPMIVAADLETPGIIETVWKRPIRMACGIVRSEIFFCLGLRNVSVRIRRTPPINNEITTIKGLPRR